MTKYRFEFRDATDEISERRYIECDDKEAALDMAGIVLLPNHQSERRRSMGWSLLGKEPQESQRLGQVMPKQWVRQRYFRDRPKGLEGNP